MKLKPAIYLITLLFIIALSHILAIKLDIYFIVPWFDVLVHFLSGIAIALGVYVFSDLFFKGNLLENTKNYRAFTIVIVFLIGLIWEVFELMIGGTFVGHEHYVSDTITDLISDVFGSVVFLSILTFLKAESFHSNDRIGK